MKKALLLIGAVAMSASAFAADGDIIFSNRNVPKAAGDGTTYNIPIKAVDGSDAGALPGGAAAGLYLQGSTTPLATAILRTDANGEFFGTPSSQTVVVTGFAPGSTPTLDFKAWQGSAGTFADAVSAGRQNFSTSFTTRPLGGTPAGGGLPITTPGVTGLGNENGAGFTLVPEPSTLSLGALGLAAMLARRRK
jgi:hypothetical protein